MQLNWRIRLKNRAWLAAFLAAIVGFAYDVAALLEVVPPVGESAVMEIITTVLSLLTMLGVVVDPTTAGVGDSERALNYK